MNTSTNQAQAQVEYLVSTAGQTNDPLPTDQEDLVRGFIPKTEQEIQDIEADILRLQALKAERSDYLWKLRGMVQPHRKLPPELLSRIFTHSLSDLEKDANRFLRIPHDLNYEKGPWVFRHVCSSWRQASLNDIGLWKQINLCYDWTWSIPDKTWEAWVYCASKILPVIGPLDFSFRVNALSSDDNGLCSQAIQHLIGPHCTRICELTLHVATINQFDSLFQPSVSFPSLRKLKLTYWDAGLEDTQRTLLFSETSIFSGSSQLRQVDLEGTALIHSLSRASARFPWGQLTKLRLSPSNSTDDTDDRIKIMTILQECRDLEECDVRVVQPFAVEFESAMGPVVLPCLQRLYVRIHDDLESLLRRLVLPCLESLELMLSQEDVYDTVAALISRSSCALNHFALEDVIYGEGAVRISRSVFIRFLQAIPAMRRLTLQVGLDERITNSIADGRLLPQVEELVCRFDITPRNMLDMLKRRFCRKGHPWENREVVPLRALTGIFQTRHSLESYEEYERALVEDYEVKIEIYYSYGVVRTLG